MLAALLAGASLSVTLPQGNVRVITVISNAGGQKQQLPLSMCQWPLWIASPGAITRLPGAGEKPDYDDPVPKGFVDPSAYEQLWLPEDLPLPECRLALGTVIKDGVPRYLFPCIETAVIRERADGAAIAWHNRGLNSVPLGATWMAWGATGPPDKLTVSSFCRGLPVGCEK